jgi:MAF protein
VKVKEGRMTKNRSYAQVVKDNALRKAKEAARKIKAGVVIGADTMMVQGKKIFGKPKNLAEARAMLKSLSSKPQIVYTGLAVMEKRQLKDKVKARLLVDYEKSKVYLDKLSKADINNYFARVSPLDKAGSYDIQGRGAFFVRRIEGCFYNVVGLPLRKLYLMLKELKVNIFIFFLFSVLCLLSSVLSGCSTEYNIATGEEEMFYYNTDKEVQMGRSIAGKVEKEYKPCQDPLVQKRLEDIGKKIAGVCDRKEIDYTFKALEDEEINAVSLPGGFVYVNTGLIEKVAGDDELSAVLAHEVGHIVARHSIKKLQALQGYSVLRVLVAVNPTTREAGTAADIAFTELLLGYSREDELLADQLAVRYAKLAGYNPHAMIDFLERLQEINRRKPLKPKTYFKTHPYVPDRIRVVKQELGEKMNFSDYINIEQQKNE